MNSTRVSRPGKPAMAALLMSALALAPDLVAQSPAFDDVFGDAMVLPYGQPVTISGSAAPGESLTLAIDGREYPVTSKADGRWETRIDPLAAGGPYSLRVRNADGQGSELDNVLAGELWLCSGQSNMAYSVSASVDQPAEYNQGHAGIRLLTIPNRAELEQQAAFPERPVWREATDDSVPRFSAVCYFFARRMMEGDGIPLGLINASWGGSAIEAWVSERGLSGVEGFDHKVAQLQQFRSDRRGAELSFGEDWVSWWDGASDQGHVWDQGVLDARRDWRAAPLENWKSYPDERLANHHGLLWYSRAFELTPEQAAKGATFALGRIDEVDSTWLNGRFVNNTFGYGSKREYPLEPGFLRPGTNQFTVNVLNTWDVGGMLGPVEEVGLQFDDGEFLPLGDDWQYLFIPRSTGQPPRSPWESVSGVSGMFNGMIAPLSPLQPTGAIWYQGESNAEYSATYGALLEALVSDWRAYFQSSDMPVLVVQLPNYGSVPTAPAESGWATIRDAQQQVALNDAGVGLVVTHDVGNDADIHPRQKFVVGTRAAQVARALRSGSGVANGVVPRVEEKAGKSLTLAFSPPLTVEGDRLVEGFSLCRSVTLNGTPDCRFTTAHQSGSRVQVNLDAMPDADSLRFCWSDGGQCALKAMNGLPVSSFELDIR